MSKRYGAIRALQAVDLEIREGEILALCGHNGAGKSTIVRGGAGGGAPQPDEGSVELRDETVDFRSQRDAQAAGIAVVEQELSVIGALTVEENLALGAVDRRLLRQRVDVRPRLALVGLEHVDPRARAAELSLAERQLLEIARALGRGADILILDEPTATLSDAEIERVFSAVRALAASGCAVIFVSHRLGEVMNLCHRVVVMRDGRLVAESRVAELSQGELVELMIGDAVTVAPRRAPRDAAVVLALEAVEVPGACRSVDLDLHAGSVTALAGQVGSGATTVLRAIAGLEPSARGVLRIGGRMVRAGSARHMAQAGVAFVSNDRKGEGLFLDRSVEENLLATRLPSLAVAGTLGRGRLRSRARALAEVAGVRADRARSPVGTLSGGNQQKVFIGRCLERSDLRVLLLDEPTRGVDVAGRAEIHALVQRAADAGVAVLFASTELDELLELADEIVTMRGGRVIGRHHQPFAARAVLGDMTHAEAVA